MSMMVFIIGLTLGAWAGFLCQALMRTARDTQGEDICNGCFGAANGDCEECTRRGETRKE